MPWIERMVIGTKDSPIPYHNEYRIQAWPHGSCIVQYGALTLSGPSPFWHGFSLDWKLIASYTSKCECTIETLWRMCPEQHTCQCWR